jgi:sulfite exporter TauE/SafE
MDPIAGFVLGLAGSLHCVGMCGPIVIAVQRQPTPDLHLKKEGERARVRQRSLVPAWSSIAPKLEYQIGRVLMYSVIGAIVGLTSSAFSLAGVGRIVTIVSGALMILFAVGELLFQRGVIPPHLAESWQRAIQRLYKRVSSERRTSRHHFVLGVLNGLLPCGLVTSALMGAVSAGSPVGGAAFMAAFGLGTMPLMLAVSIAGVSLSCTLRKRLRVSLPIFALALGSLIFLRGLALGIPFVSPSLPVSQTAAECHTTSSGHERSSESLTDCCGYPGARPPLR